MIVSMSISLFSNTCLVVCEFSFLLGKHGTFFRILTFDEMYVWVLGRYAREE